MNTAEQPAYMKPVPTGRRVGTALLGLALIGVGVWMFMTPGLFETFDPNEIGRHRTRFWATVIAWAWSRPVGALAGLLGVAMLLMARSKFEDTRSLREIAEASDDVKK